MMKIGQFSPDLSLFSRLTNGSDLKKLSGQYKSYIHLLASHFIFTNSLLTICLQCIDTGKIFNARKDRRDPNVVATRTDGHNLGYTGFSLDDFKCVKRDKACSFKKRFAVVFKSWSYTTFDNVFLSPISGICEAIYQSKFAYSNLYLSDHAILSVS